MSENTEITQDEITTLKARADRMGLSYHPSIGVEKLREKLAAAMAGEPPKTDPAAVGAVAPAPTAVPAPEVETEGQRRKRMKLAATRLVRIRLTCMNPAKKDHDGEIYSVGNSLVGTLTRFIPYNADEGWHVPNMMYEFLKDKQCQVFITVKTKAGVAVRQGKLMKEFAIELLPDLTADELHDLAQRQAMAAGT